MQVPLLTIVPIPFIRVATTDIDMSVKINSIYNTDTSTDTKSTLDTKTNANYGFLFAKGSININASVAHQKKTSEREEVKKEYSLNIRIHAVQDDMPAGMSRVLDILEESIVPRAAAAKQAAASTQPRQDAV